MAKPKLTKEAIEFIVNKYDSRTENYTFSEVAKLVKDKFDIDVSLQAIQQNYHKYVEDIKKKEADDSLSESKSDIVQSPKSANSILDNFKKSKELSSKVNSKKFINRDENKINLDDIAKALQPE